MTMTSRSASTPSISARACGTIVDSMSELMPVPRVRKSKSISSKKTAGTPSSAFSRPLEDLQPDLALHHVLVQDN